LFGGDIARHKLRKTVLRTMRAYLDAMDTLRITYCTDIKIAAWVAALGPKMLQLSARAR